MKKIILLTWFVVALMLVSAPAFAATINSLIVSGPNQASDEDREALIDRVVPLDGAGNPIYGQLDIGDSLYGMIGFNTMNSASANVGGLTGNDELTGIFAVQLTSIVGTPGALGSQYIFGPDPRFELAFGSGAIAALYTSSIINYASDFDDAGAPTIGPDDGTPSRTTPPSPADVGVGPYETEGQFLATAADGDLWAVAGFLGLPGEGILTVLSAAGFDNVLLAFALTSGTTGANANLALNLLYTGPAWDPNIMINRVTPSPFGGTVDFALSQQLRGVSDLDTPWEISSNTNVSFNASRIPEPSTFLLLGGGLLGLGALRRKRKM